VLSVLCEKALGVGRRRGGHEPDLVVAASGAYLARRDRLRRSAEHVQQSTGRAQSNLAVGRFV